MIKKVLNHFDKFLCHISKVKRDHNIFSLLFASNELGLDKSLFIKDLSTKFDEKVLAGFR